MIDNGPSTRIWFPIGRLPSVDPRLESECREFVEELRESSFAPIRSARFEREYIGFAVRKLRENPRSDERAFGF